MSDGNQSRLFAEKAFVEVSDTSVAADIKLINYEKDFEKELRNDSERCLYDALPHRFELGDGMKIAQEYGMPQRTYVRFVSDRRDLFTQPQTGVREKQD